MLRQICRFLIDAKHGTDADLLAPVQMHIRACPWCMDLYSAIVWIMPKQWARHSGRRPPPVHRWQFRRALAAAGCPRRRGKRSRQAAQLRVMRGASAGETYNLYTGRFRPSGIYSLIFSLRLLNDTARHAGAAGAGQGESVMNITTHNTTRDPFRADEQRRQRG